MNYQPDFEMAHRVADKDNARLRIINAELLAALEGLLAAEGPYHQGSEDDDAREKAYAAIAKAKGQA